MAKVEIPQIDWFERYKRLIDIGYGMLGAADDYIYHNWGEEEWLNYIEETRPKWSGRVAKRLVEKFGPNPDIEGVLKLLGIYAQEVWGFGDPRFVDSNLETPTKGTWTNLVCRSWELMSEGERATAICDKACIWEWKGVVGALSPDIKVTMVKAYPRGDDRCEFTLEM